MKKYKDLAIYIGTDAQPIEALVCKIVIRTPVTSDFLKH